MKSKKNLRTRSLMWVAAGAVAGLSLGATGLVHAATGGSSDNTVVSAPADSSTDDTSAAPAADIGGDGEGRVSNETPLTGETADKVTAAALAAAPGATVDRVETDDSGHAYEAHVTLADGSKKILFFNESFEADGEETAPAGGRGGKGGHGGPQETALTGETADKVTAAALAAEPGSTVIRVETDDTHAYEAHVTLADGSEKVLFFNESFEADGSEVPPAGGRGDMGGRGGHGGRGDHAHDADGNDIPAGQAPPADSTAPSSTTNG